jgi:hypothetical protein
MSSKVLSSGESPPWTQKNCLFMMAARGSAQNEFMQASYTRSEYLRLPIRDSQLKDPQQLRMCRLTLEFEGEVISQMSTFVIASQEEDGIGIPDLKRPQVEYTLRGQGEARLRHSIGYFMRTSILKYPLST